MQESKKINYPYLPEGRTIQYVPESNPFMIEAKEFARGHSLDKVMPTGSVLIKNNEVIGRAANGSSYHETHVCERVKQGIPTGQRYDLCEGCHPKNHSETGAILDAKNCGHDTDGTDLYLWGHWWCCALCWENIIKAGVWNVYLMETSEILFNKEHQGNIVGRQFE